MVTELKPVLNSADIKREDIRNKVLEGLQESFPVNSRSKTLEVRDLSVVKKDYTPSEQKQAILRGDTLSECVKGTVRMKDNEGNVIDEIKDFTIARIPWFTNRHTMIVGGNEYSTANQVRPKPGIYTRKRANGILEASFNTKGGSNFNVTMDPEKGLPSLEYGASQIPLYPILRKAGVTHEAISKSWGDRLANANAKKTIGTTDKAVDKLYNKVVPEYQRSIGASTDAKTNDIFQRYARSEMDPHVNAITVGNPYSNVTPDSLLDASKKVLHIFQNPEEVDDRDNLDFKALHSVDDFMKEVVVLNSREVARKAAIKMESTPDLKKAIPSGPFTAGILRFINGSQLVTVPTQTNPMELIDSAMRVTSMGEGGISSDRAIPMEARQVHVTQLGALDPFRTPESFRAGVDVRAAMGVKKDKKGNIYVPVKAPGKPTTNYVRAGELKDAVIAFPNQKMSGKVDALVNGNLKKVPANTVKYVLPHPSMSYSPTTNLVPFIESLQGNRAVMGSKMQTQALSLVDREAPLVQVKAADGKSFEHHMASLINPQSNVSGTVAKVDKDYIYIRPDNVKVSAKGGQLIKIPYETNFPLAAKTYLNHDLKVKKGDSVEKGTILAESNFTKDRVLSLGKNLSVAYMPYKGANSNDAVVISEDAAKKLTSERMYKITIPVDVDTSLGRAKHQTYYGHSYTNKQYKPIDKDGVIVPGTKILPNDPLFLGLRKSKMSAEDMLLGRLHKSLAKPFREQKQLWDHDHAGEVVDVVKTPKRITMTVKTQESMGIGDKLCFTEDHDILTVNGWVPVADVTSKDKCYTLNNKGDIELQKPSALHHYDQADELYILKSQQVNLKVTPNHNLYVKLRNSDAYKLYKASDVIGKRVRHKKNGNWISNTPEEFNLPEVFEEPRGNNSKVLNSIPIVPWCVFLGMYLANGSHAIRKRKDRNSFEYKVDIHTIKDVVHSVSGNQYEWVQKTLNQCDFNFSKSDDRFTISSKQLATYVSQFGNAKDKYIPKIVFQWGKDAALALLEGLLGCDGHKTTSGSLGYTTVSKRLADDVQRLALHCGYASNISIKKSTNIEWSTCYIVSIIKTKLEPQINHGHTNTQKGQSEQIKASTEPVYGITVPNNILYVRYKGTPVWTGNSGRGGNKGVVSKIIPNDQMIKDEAGKPIDVIMTSAGVVSRTNPAIILESAVGKVAEKIGKPIVIDNLSGRDNIAWAKDLLKKHKVKDKETVYDPVTDKKIPKVFVGRQYIMKLMKSTDTNYSARGLGNYDVNQQPTKGGTASAKALGKMEFDALVGHNARNILREAATLKSQKNDEYWKALQLGYPTPPPKTAFATDKFLGMLTGAGVRVERDSNRMSLAPLTDKDTLEMSSGEIKKPLLVRSKDLKPEQGGLFDTAITGGLTGTKWSHINLAEPIVNPTFREPVRRLLGMTNAQLDDVLKEKGGDYVKKQLKNIDLAKKEKELLSGLKRKSNSTLDDSVKQVKYIRSLRDQGKTPDEAYIVSKVPVLPPAFRPVVPGTGSQDIIYGDINPLYRDLLYVNDQAKEVKNIKELPDEIKKLRPGLNSAVGAVYGINEPITAKSKARGHKGFLTYISGRTTPKNGYFQSKLMKRNQDMAGRGTAVPDNTLGMDEVGLPENMVWSMYDKFLIKNLVQRGYPAVKAAEMVKDKHPAAKELLITETKERPVIVNRAPTLHRYSMVGAFPKMVPGKTIRVNPFIESGTNLDYDGDSCSSMLIIYTDKPLKLQYFLEKETLDTPKLDYLAKISLDDGIDSCIPSGYYHIHIRNFPRLKEKVKMKNGNEIYEVPQGVSVFGFSEKTQTVQLCDVTHFSIHTNLKMNLITTINGKSVQISAQDSMFGMNPDTGVLERFNPEKNPNWGIPRPAKIETELLKQVGHIDWSIYTPHARDINTIVDGSRTSVNLTAGFGWLMGVYVGNGWVTYQALDRTRDNSLLGQAIGLSSNVVEIRDEFKKQTQKLVSGRTLKYATYDNPHKLDGTNCFSQSIRLHDASLADAWGRLFEHNRGAENKCLPTFFTRAPKEFLYGLLSGLLDSDGTVSIVKAKAKKEPQIMIHYYTISPKLADDVSTLCLLLGVSTSIHFDKKKRCYQVSLNAPELQVIGKHLKCYNSNKQKNINKLIDWDFTYYHTNLPKINIPIAEHTATNLLKLIGPVSLRAKAVKACPEKLSKARKLASITNILYKARKTGRMGRATLETLIKLYGGDAVKKAGGTDWFNNVTNPAIKWDFIESVEPIEGRHTAWDLTVPDGNTFMTSNQLIVYDTLMIHVPVGDKAVEEAKGMTLSNMLYSDKARGDLLVFPEHEAIMGLAHATTGDAKNTPIKFKDKKEAIQAYKDGKIKMDTRVSIGK